MCPSSSEASIACCDSRCEGRRRVAPRCVIGWREVTMFSLANRLRQAAVACGLVACAAQTSPPPAHPEPLRFEPGVAEVGRKEKLIALAPQLDAFFRERMDARGA